jgi:hypothetical protein
MIVEGGAAELAKQLVAYYAQQQVQRLLQLETGLRETDNEYMVEVLFGLYKELLQLRPELGQDTEEAQSALRLYYLSLGFVLERIPAAAAELARLIHFAALKRVRRPARDALEEYDEQGRRQMLSEWQLYRSPIHPFYLLHQMQQLQVARPELVIPSLYLDFQTKPEYLKNVVCLHYTGEPLATQGARTAGVGVYRLSWRLANLIAPDQSHILSMLG